MRKTTLDPFDKETLRAFLSWVRAFACARIRLRVYADVEEEDLDALVYSLLRTIATGFHF